MINKNVVIGIVLATLPTLAASQEPDRKYVAGIRSGLITGTMRLSGLDPAFDDLAPNGPTGPHMSGFFLMYKVRPQLRVGIETLVASSDKNEVTTMNYQAAGPVVEVSYGKSWFIAGGIHGGALIVNAMASQGATPREGAAVGSFLKRDGGFLAPSVDVGRRFRRYEASLYMKRVSVFGGKDRGALSDFSSTFAGLRLGVGL